MKLLFERKLRITACFSDCTTCIIKPHVIHLKQIGSLIKDIINSNFEISAMEMFYLTSNEAEQFF